MSTNSDSRHSVCLFTPILGHGGAEKHLMRVANYLDRDRFAPFVSPIRAGGSYEQQLFEDVPCIPCTRRIKSSTLSTLVAARPLAKILDQQESDLVFSIMPAFHSAASKAVRLSKRKPKLVLGFQNNLSVEIQQMPSWRRKLLLPQISEAVEQANHIIALSKGVAADLQERYSISEDKIDVIYNAAYDEEIVIGSKEPLDIPRPEGPLLIACGRLTEQKDYPTMLRAFARVRAEIPATLWVLGDGPLRGEIEAMAKELKIEDSIDFLGFRDNPFRYMAAADLFVLSSAWEGFGNVVVEALACGTPVVSTACPYGPSEILEDGKYGDLVDVGDAEGLSRAIVNLFKDQSRLESQASSAIPRAREFASEVIAKQYGESFAKVIG